MSARSLDPFYILSNYTKWLRRKERKTEERNEIKKEGGKSDGREWSEGKEGNYIFVFQLKNYGFFIIFFSVHKFQGQLIYGHLK